MLKRVLGSGRLERKHRNKAQRVKTALFCGTCGNEFMPSDIFCQQCGRQRVIACTETAISEHDCELAAVPRRRFREGDHFAPPPRECHFGFGSLLPSRRGGEANSSDQEHESFLSKLTGQKRRRSEFVKEELLKARNTTELVDIANQFIEEDWLLYEEFPGNTYRIAAFGKMFWFNEKTRCLTDLSRMFGCSLIFFIQMFGPPLLFGSGCLGWGIRPSFYADEVAVPGFWDLSAWENRRTTKILAMVFIATFCLNGIFVILDERKSWKKMNDTFRYLNRRTDAFLRGEGFLFLDAFANCWVILWCSLCTMVVIAPASTPKDVVFDSLGLLFLYNLDDIGGDFGFLNADDWPGRRLAWIHAEMIDKDRYAEYDTALGDGAAPSRDGYDGYDEKDDACFERFGRYLALGVYDFTVFVLTIYFLILPPISAVTSFEADNRKTSRLGLTT